MFFFRLSSSLLQTKIPFLLLTTYFISSKIIIGLSLAKALARLKPIIIFDDIKYVVNNRKGIFVCKRDEESLKKNINFILNNYKNIQKKIKKNYFYTKDNFNKELLKYIKNEFKN